MTRRLEAEPESSQPPADSLSHLRERPTEDRALPGNLVSQAQPVQQPAPAPVPPAPPPQAPSGDQPAQAPAPADAAPSVPAEPAAPAEGQKPAEVQPTAKAVIMGFDGKPYEFAHDQLRDIIRGYYHYESQVQAIQAKIDQERQAVQAERQALEAQMQSDDGLILNYLKKSETFKNKVLELIDALPDLSTDFKSGQKDLTLKTLEEKVAALEAQRKQEAEAMAARQQEAARQAVINEIRSKVDALNSNLKIPDRYMEALTTKALHLVQTGRLQFAVDPLVKWFRDEMQAFADDRRAIEEQAKNAYLQRKSEAPPPPPSNGGTPPVAPPVLEPGRERIRAVAARLARLGANA